MKRKVTNGWVLHNRGSMRGDLWPEVSRFLGDRARNTGTLHLPLRVDDNAGIVLKVDDSAILAAPALPLADDNGRHHLLAEFGLALLNASHHHVANTTRREAVEASVVAAHRNDVEILCAGVVRAVHHGAHGHGQRDAELLALNGSLSATHYCAEVDKKRERR